MSDGVKVLMADVKAARCCWSGFRRILTLAKVSNREFFRSGVDAELVEFFAVTPMQLKVAEVARERAAAC